MTLLLLLLLRRAKVKLAVKIIGFEQLTATNASNIFITIHLSCLYTQYKADKNIVTLPEYSCLNNEDIMIEVYIKEDVALVCEILFDFIRMRDLLLDMFAKTGNI